ncbi:MAG: hypothetical protein KBH07_09445 [Flavobacteriales bacterium]|nr:hypothetical protein [Flavobacteriales bacterium]MBP9080597.1 hypothetical protein [Flavobacteriales bacterium]
MLRLLLRTVFLLLLTTGASTVAQGQAGIGQRDQERIQEKKQKTDAKEVKKEEKRLRKKHLSNQDKATRKRMKRNKRRAGKQGNSGHRDPFLRRLFGSRH